MRLPEGGHEQIIYGYDHVSGLRAIIAIHSTALGPALGGTRFFRMRPNTTPSSTCSVSPRE